MENLPDDFGADKNNPFTDFEDVADDSLPDVSFSLC